MYTPTTTSPHKTGSGVDNTNGVLRKLIFKLCGNRSRRPHKKIEKEKVHCPTYGRAPAITLRVYGKSSVSSQECHVIIATMPYKASINPTTSSQFSDLVVNKTPHTHVYRSVLVQANR